MRPSQSRPDPSAKNALLRQVSKKSLKKKSKGWGKTPYDTLKSIESRLMDAETPPAALPRPLQRQQIPFLTSLRELLDDAKNLGYEDVVSWQTDGTSFKVHNVDLFANVILGRYFNQTKYKSFQRQLNMYGFSRILLGSLKGGYFHTLFIRSQPYLSDMIVRNQPYERRAAAKKGTQCLPASSATTPRDRCEDTSTDHIIKPLGWKEYSPSSLLRQADVVFDTKPLVDTNKTFSENDKTLHTAQPVIVHEAHYSPLEQATLLTATTTKHSFPWKLHCLLEDAEREGFTNIVSWNDSGTAFKVHDTDAFEGRIIGNYFDQIKYESFRRQLSIYGFVRVASGIKRGFYSHDMFIRSNVSLCSEVHRNPIKSSTSKAKASNR